MSREDTATPAATAMPMPAAKPASGVADRGPEMQLLAHELAVSRSSPRSWIGKHWAAALGSRRVAGTTDLCGLASSGRQVEWPQRRHGRMAGRRMLQDEEYAM